MELVKEIQNNNINQIQILKKFKEFEDWVDVFYKDKEKLNKINLPIKIDDSFKTKIFQNYKKLKSAGKIVSIEDIISIEEDLNNSSKNFYKKIEFPQENNNSCKIEKKEKVHNIEVSNIGCAIRELIDNLESIIFEVFDNEIYKKYLQVGEYEKFDLNLINLQSNWAKNQLNSGKATKTSIRDELINKKEEINWALKVHQTLKPLLDESLFIISLIPILMTMICENSENENFKKLKEDLEKIFSEFSIGPKLERLSFNLKEKFIKRKNIEEFILIRNEIQKELKNIENNINFQIVSNLRRLKMQTIIDDELFNKALNYGIDLSGLRAKFGVVKVPVHFKDLKISAFRLIIEKLSELKNILNIRVKEEINNLFHPNLKDLLSLIENIHYKIEDDNLKISDHIIPIFIIGVQKINQVIDSIFNWINILQKNTLNYFINKIESKEIFYNKLCNYYENLQYNFSVYEDLINFVSLVCNADQSLSLKISTMDFTEDEYTSGFQSYFEKDKLKLVELKNLNLIDDLELNNYMMKLKNAEEVTQKFVKKYTHYWFKLLV